MAVQVRRGPYSDFNANKLVPGEWAAVTSGDPNASDGCATYMCFAPGNVKRMATYEDMAENINAATSEIQGNFSAEMNAAMGAANAAAASAQSAAAEAETAKESANTAAANANTAAEAANAAANGDVSGKTVTFQEATERANVQSGDSLEVAFGKLAKFCADLKDYAFEDTVKNLTTGEQGKALDATMGKALDEKIGNLNDLTTTSKDSVVDAVDELNMNMIPKPAEGSVNFRVGVSQYFSAVSIYDQNSTWKKYLLSQKGDAQLYAAQYQVLLRDDGKHELHFYDANGGWICKFTAD